jgi:pyruvate dehydrogenase E1 component beta subunit
MDTPISETAFIGAATGAAAAGLRPIVELMFVDFFGVCMDQIYNHLAKNTYMSGGHVKLPVVLTTAIGGGYNDAAQHSQCLYGTFAHMPGIKVVVPSNAYDAKGLMIQAIRDDNPVMFMYHKGIMGLPWMAYFEGSSNGVPEDSYVIPFGKANIVKEGTDITIVSISQMVQKAVLAANELAEQSIHAEVLDLRTLVPMDTEAILKSVRKTGRLIIADEDYLGFGLSGEISALIAENLDTVALKAPIKRLAVPNVPIPYSRPLEQFVIPQVANIVLAAQELMLKKLPLLAAL